MFVTSYVAPERSLPVSPRRTLSSLGVGFAVAGLVLVGAPSAHANTLNLADEVTTDWVCQFAPHRATDFDVQTNTQVDFAITKFDETLGEFRRIDVSQEIELIASVTASMAMANPPALIRISTDQQLWMQIPPASATPFPTDDPALEVSVGFPISWANGQFQNGFYDFGARTLHDAAQFSSTDAATWSGVGEHTLTLQSQTSMSILGGGGNVSTAQTTTASAEVCYRYTYVPTEESNEEVVPSPSPSPDPDLQLETLAITGGSDGLLIGLAGAALLAGGAVLIGARRRSRA